MPFRAFAVLFGMVLLAAQAGAQTLGRDSLNSIGPIDVVIEGGTPGAKRDGLTRQMLQTAVEVRLRQKGIPLDEDASPYLYVKVNTVKSGEQYAYCVSVELHQKVLGLAKPTVMDARTWRTIGFLGLVSAARLRDVVRDGVLELVDSFSNDYVAVNSQALGQFR